MHKRIDVALFLSCRLHLITKCTKKLQCCVARSGSKLNDNESGSIFSPNAEAPRRFAFIPENSHLCANEPVSVQPSVSHVPQGFLNGVGKNRHVFKMHASTVLVEVEADEGEIRVVVPKGLENRLSGGHIGMIYVA